MRHLLGSSPVLWVTFFSAVVAALPSWGQGIVLPGVGPVNRSMAGAATAAPIDATGAIHWNPGSITGLNGSSVDLGVEFLNSRVRVSSTLPAGAFGPGVPAAQLSGSDDGNHGVSALPAIALVYKPCPNCSRSSGSPGHRPNEQCASCSPWTFGLGLNAIGGFYVNFPASQSNPIFTPQAPNGFGQGNVYGRLGLLQVAPTVARQVTDRLSIGVAPTVTIADLQVNPGAFGTPDDANGDGFASYPSAQNGRLRYGLGFQIGVYLTTESCWNFGFSFKSPQWFERFEFNATNELGLPTQVTTNIDYPMILSWGTSYSGFERLLVALDVRLVDYASADGFGDATGYTSTGKVTGLGWQSVVMVGLGAQYQLNDKIKLRAGYSYNENPIPDQETFFALTAPGIFQHVMNLGASFQIRRDIGLTAAWVHGFENSIEGPFVIPSGAVAGSSVKIRQETDHLAAGLTISF